MSDPTNDIWPQWDSGDRVQAGTRVYDSKGVPGFIAEVVPGRLRPIPGPYGGAYPPRVTMQFDGGDTAAVSFDVFDKLDSGWRRQKNAGASRAAAAKPGRSGALGWAGLALGVVAAGILLSRRK